MSTISEYEDILDAVPLSLWIGDFAEMFDAIEPLKSIPNLSGYLEERPEVVWALAGKVKTTKANQYALDLFEVDSQEMLFDSVDKIFLADTIPVWIAQIVAWAKGETYFRAETPVVTVRGKRLYVMIQVNLISPPGARPRIGLCCHLDLTQRKILEDALVRSNHELEQFASVASHDLQEPLRMVASYTELLARRYEDQLDDRARKYITYAVDGAKRMRELISGLLSYSRVGANPPEAKPVNLEQLVTEVQKSIEVLIAESEAEITCDRLPMVMGDRMLLSQLLQNLLTNAIKFRRAEAPRIHIGAAPYGSMWTLSVKDNGIGIAKEHLESVFSIFKRVHSRGEYPGTGLGLAIAERIVTHHDGRIWIESEPGAGSTFFFTLPAVF